MFFLGFTVALSTPDAELDLMPKRLLLPMTPRMKSPREPVSPLTMSLPTEQPSAQRFSRMFKVCLFVLSLLVTAT